MHFILLCGRKSTRALDHLREYGIEPFCTYPARDAENPPRGCYQAHADALQLAQRNQWLPCVVLEDNVEVTPDFELTEMLEAIAYCLQQYGPSIINLNRYPFSKRGKFFGLTPTESTAHPSVLRLHPDAVSGTTAYVATQRTLDLWPKWANVHIDHEIAKWPDRYALYPMPFRRFGQPSSNNWTIDGRIDGKPMPMREWIPLIIPTYCQYMQHIDNKESLLIFVVVLMLATVIGISLYARR